MTKLIFICVENSTMEKIIKILLLLFCLLVVSYSFSQAPKYSNEFLSIGIGSRGLAMGNSVVASTNNTYATFWNPSQIQPTQDDMTIGIMHAEYFAGLAKYDFLSFIRALNEKNTIGFSLIRFGVDNIPNTLELIDNNGNIRYDQIQSFSIADYGFLFSFAHKMLIEHLHLGGNVKIIHRVAGSFGGAWGFGFDISGHYTYNKWLFGATLRDATSTFNAWSFNTDELEDVFLVTGNEIPTNHLEITLPKLLLGFARKITISNKFNLLTELDLDVTFDGRRNTLIYSNPVSIDPHLGLELNFKDLIFFRAGIMNLQKIPTISYKDKWNMQPNLGLGIHFQRFRIAYALTNIGNNDFPLFSNVFSLQYALPKPNPKTKIHE